MPPKEYEKGQPFFAIDGERLEPLTLLSDDGIEMIQTSDLEDNESHNFDDNKEFEITFEVDKEAARKFYSMASPQHGEKLVVETSCVCDSTLVFLIQLIQTLKKMGCTNIKWRSEEVENPNPAWMSTRFIATGIIWNTNNFRKLHGIPIKRRFRHGSKN